MAWRKFEGSIRQLNTHCNFINDIVEIGTLGLVDDVTGSEAAAEAAIEGTRLSSEATLAATEKNIDFQKFLWGEQTALQQPYMDAGGRALSKGESMLNRGFTYDPNTDPSTEFRRKEGQRGLENSASARGMSLSGSTLKDIVRYNSDYASTEYGNAYNRWQNDLKNQFGLAQMGQAAASGVSSAGTSMGNQVSQSIGQAGQAQSQMYQDIGNIRGAQAMSGFNSLLDIGNMAANFYKP